ncbi:MAG: hypothetical protein DRO12_00670 [Thermoprotei archaeon]|nr:MAG: hypothetical protein DRO12_00670 [Thermoprotei archaeon]
MDVDVLANVLANVLYEIEERKISLDRAFTCVCRRVKCSSKSFTREEIHRIAEDFLRKVLFLYRYVENSGRSASRRSIARLYLFLESRRLGIKFTSRMRKTLLRQYPFLSQTLEADEEKQLVLSYPEWFYQELVKLLGVDETVKLLKALDQRVMWLRVNTLLIDIDKAVKILEDEGVRVEEVKRVPFLLKVIKSKKPIRNTRLFREGKVIIQDKASVFTVLALQPEPGDTVYDFAAAPGIKTSLIMQLTDNRARVVAMDLSPKRLKSMKALLKKYGVKVERIDLVLADTRIFRPRGLADLALVDAPCSSSGAIPKDPAIKLFLRDRERVRKFAQTQFKMLVNALKSAERVVYATCSIMPMEGEEVVLKVLNEVDTHSLADPPVNASRGYRRYSIWNKVRRTYPHVDECEGFFISLLTRA